VSSDSEGAGEMKKEKGLVSIEFSDPGSSFWRGLLVREVLRGVEDEGVDGWVVVRKGGNE
jgi:hypothetical protein